MPKQILFEDKAREKLFAGIETMAKTVGVTLGPAGRNVILEKSFGAPTVTKDGVSVAKEVEVADPFENLGAKMVREAASKTNDEAGDGTTTATVLAAEMVRTGLKYMASGASPVGLRDGVDAAVAAAVLSIEAMARPAKSQEDMAKVATISANHDAEIGQIIATVLDKTGEKGVVTVEEAQGVETTSEYVDGMSFDKGYVSPYFVTDLARMTAEHQDALVFIYEKKISDLMEFLPLLESVSKTGRPLLVIAEDVEAEALAGLVVNKLRGVMNVVAVKAPGFGDRRKAMLGDVAVLTGANAVMEETGRKLQDCTVADCGRVSKLTVEKERTVLVGGGGKKAAIQERVRQIQAQIERTTSEYDREKLEERLAKLAGGVAVIKVGGATESEMKERKDRVDDALHATRAAREEGVVPGGGVALLRASAAVEAVMKAAEGDAKLGADVVLRALKAPARLIADNAGFDGSLVVEEILDRKGWNGFNALTGEYEDMGKSGVLDPAKVVRAALQNAASIAGMLLTTNTLVADLKDDAKEPVAGAVA